MDKGKQQKNRITIKQNPRNIVMVTPFVVFKYRRDWNLRKIFWEFALTWKAFLNGVADLPILIGPVMVKRTSQGVILAKADLKSSWKSVIKAAAELSRRGIEHKELRHPQYHVIVERGGTVKILDFERGKLSKKPRNLSRLTVWLLERGVDPEEIEKVLNEVETLEEDRKGALKAVKRWKEILLSHQQDAQDRPGREALSC